jgi:hypothetical protein
MKKCTKISPFSHFKKFLKKIPLLLKRMHKSRLFDSWMMYLTLLVSNHFVMYFFPQALQAAMWKNWTNIKSCIVVSYSFGRVVSVFWGSKHILVGGVSSLSLFSMDVWSLGSSKEELVWTWCKHQNQKITNK